MKVALSTDHAGYEAIGALKALIESLGHEVIYFGPESYNPEDDYPEFIFRAAHAVSDGEAQGAVILGGSGQGEAMAANRIKGVRAAVFYGPVIAKTAIDADGNQSDDPYEIVKLSRQHNDSNVLSLSGRFLTPEEMENAVKTWLHTPFSGLDRHTRRNQQLDQAG